MKCPVHPYAFAESVVVKIFKQGIRISKEEIKMDSFVSKKTYLFQKVQNFLFLVAVYKKDID